ncbi:Glyco_hydro_15 domain-containing protein [Mucor velutinosus]|uniref:Glyco_hydro_15 domain-containing protein n=1 Tax=Mucor velutinosus TaxID=708070 RepID=A0AAN7D7C8_9FUNG|nr:Glyco_hydro_15 domain-containing protein [Mucor velutinosus]
MTALETVYAVHNFEAENDDELSFQIGERVFVIQKDDGFGDGWWKGENVRGQVGLFPMNYITFEQPHRQITDLLTPSTFDSTNATTSTKEPMPIDTSVLEDEISKSPSVRSSYSFTCPVSSSSTTGPGASSTHSNSGGAALRRSVINALFLPSLRPTTPEDWDIDQVETWLNAMNFGSIATHFKLQEITGDVLLELNMNSLKELDIPTFGKRFKLHTAISALREECGYQPTNHMSITSSTYSTDSRFLQQKNPTSSSTSPSSARYSNPIYTRHSASYHSNLMTLDKQHQRSRSHTSGTPKDQTSLQMLSPVSPASCYDIMEANSQNYERDQKLPVSPSKKDMALIQQVQKRQTVLPTAHRSSMEIYSTRTTDETGAVTPDMEGWLYKQGCKYKKWNKRWFVLKGPNLFYFKSPKDVRMKGIINLRGYKVVPDETIQPGKYSFKAQHEEERTFYFYTDLDTSMKSWISSLMKATISRDFTAPVLSSSMIPTVSLDVARRMRPRPPSVLLYRKDNNANLSPRSYEASYGYQTPISEKSSSIITADKDMEGGESSVTTKEERLNQDSGFDSNDQEEEGEDEEEDEEVEEAEEENEEETTTPPFGETYSLAYKDVDEDEGHLSSEECREEPNQPLSWTPVEYIQWVNAISSSTKIKELHELRQGDVLIEILEELSGKNVKQLPPSTVGSVSMMMLDNIVAVFKFMSMEGIEIDSQFAIKDIFGGNEEKIMLLLQSILKWSARLNEISF